MREIIFDTETTGFDPAEHRIVEIGAVELVNRLPTGRIFHKYLNPEREIDWQATRVHGITNERVANEPKFAEIVEEMLAFFGPDAKLVAHNAMFDMGFVNMELTRCNCATYPLERFIDTLEIAKRKLPGQRHNLDALCRAYGIDNTGRTFHGALLDAQLLADVYVELHGGLQGALTLENSGNSGGGQVARSGPVNRTVVAPTAEERERHQAFLSSVSGHRWPQ